MKLSDHVKQPEINLSCLKNFAELIENVKRDEDARFHLFVQMPMNNSKYGTNEAREQ